ncbi:MAG: hypothetical protein JJLCMIEE_01283 [Acidimicrobiales bacterium]|nr:hypothetical protein [Acidimicrobiales bacterium]
MTDVGFLIVYLAWGFGVATIVAGLALLGRSQDRSPSPSGRQLIGLAVTLVGCLGLLASLALPWISGLSAGDQRELVESGWTGLDPLTTGAIAGLCGLAGLYVLYRRGGGVYRRLLMLSTGWCVLGLVVGNLVIQSTTSRGSSMEWGAFVSLGAALVVITGLYLAASAGAPGSQAAL